MEQGATTLEALALIERLDRLVGAFLTVRKDGVVFADIGQHFACFLPMLDDRSLQGVLGDTAVCVVSVDGFATPEKGACGKGIRNGFLGNETAKYTGRPGGARNTVSERQCRRGRRTLIPQHTFNFGTSGLWSGSAHITPDMSGFHCSTFKVVSVLLRGKSSFSVTAASCSSWSAAEKTM